MRRTAPKPTSTRNRLPRPGRARPRVEPLESRALLALALDSSFGSGGTLPIALASPSAEVVQPDGKIVLAGLIGETGPTDYPGLVDAGLTRLNPDGSTDPTFHAESLGGSFFDQGVLSLALQPDGKILVAGISVSFDGIFYDTRFVKRFNADGTIDTSFGTAGTFSSPAHGPDLIPDPQAIAIQPGGKVVFAGEGQAVRLNANGTLDTSFGTGGQVMVPALANSVTDTTLAIQANGQIVLGGTIAATSDSPPDLSTQAGRIQLVRLNSDGSIDATYNPMIAPAGSTALEKLGGIVLQPDGKLVGVATSAAPGSNGLDSTLLAFRVDADGSLDPSFGQAGVARLSGIGTVATTSQGPSPALIALAPSGKIVLSALATGPALGLEVVELNADGSVSDGDGAGGKTFFAYTSQPSLIGPRALAVQADGKPLLYGGFAGPIGSSDALIRLNAQSAPGDFDGDGKSDLGVAFRAPDIPGQPLPTSEIIVYRPSSGGADQGLKFGPPFYLFPVSGDFDGDGKADFATYAYQIGYFSYHPSAGGPDVNQAVADRDTLPAVGDYDGSGHSEFGVYYPQYGVFANLPVQSNGQTSVQFGVAGQSLPATGDYDGSGRTELAYYDIPNSSFHYRPANGSADQTIQFGPAGVGFTPALGDYDGDGKTDLALYTPQTSVFLYQPSSGGAPVAVQFGPPDAGFVAVPGDYDGDGKTDLAIYNSQYGLFIYRPSSGGPDRLVLFGPGGDAASAVLAAPDASDLSSDRVESISAESLAPPIAIAPMDADPIQPLGSARSASVRRPNPTTLIV